MTNKDIAERASIEEAQARKAEAKRLAKNKARRDRNALLRDLGLTRVRGNMGGIYWE